MLDHESQTTPIAHAHKETALMAKTALQQIRDLEEQKAAIIDKAKQEAVTQAEQAISDLNELGFSYRLTSDDASSSTKPRGAKKRTSNPDRPCPICEFKTDPAHDARHHRSQGDDKATFTDAELHEKGYTRAA